MNALNFGVPQSRNRCFVVSVLNGNENSFKIPKGFQLPDNVLKKYLEDNPLGCYISNDTSKSLINDLVIKGYFNDSDTCLKGLLEPFKNNFSLIANTVMSKVKNAHFELVKSSKDKLLLKQRIIVAQRGRYTSEHKTKQQLEPRGFDFTNCLTTVAKDNLILEKYITYTSNSYDCKYKLRTLTPKEMWLLMGFSDSDFNKVSRVTKKNELIKQAGNSIVVPVLENIFSSLFIE